jgi:hypothetical protein
LVDIISKFVIKNATAVLNAKMPTLKEDLIIYTSYPEALKHPRDVGMDEGNPTLRAGRWCWSNFARGGEGRRGWHGEQVFNAATFGDKRRYGGG